MILNLVLALLVARIWRIDHMNKQSGVLSYGTSSQGSRHVTRLERVMHTVIESGAMYTIVALVTFITYIAKSNSTYGVCSVVRNSPILIFAWQN